ncbi:hypothetical protein N7509_013530 [Penicillium cosmopolitanum]|uniref:Uncharacterized protein n=1 Tax=Penicillium cosmopolitanum TaxID=1131564 RepID=A0A9W9VDE3_9EURO|nr:uncharacterized protein N7509_013530 [Penicillium cosmopolitanum]KAJ5376644.1 hypothetical protein N7509_013530 [Penicillium cosmopolitanum]
MPQILPLPQSTADPSPADTPFEEWPLSEFGESTENSPPGFWVAVYSSLELALVECRFGLARSCGHDTCNDCISVGSLEESVVVWVRTPQAFGVDLILEVLSEGSLVAMSAWDWNL